MDYQAANDHGIRERECLHRQAGAPGDFYSGVLYVQALQKLRSDAAVRAARKIGPFFWSDAPLIRVWLCDACARETGLRMAANG